MPHPTEQGRSHRLAALTLVLLCCGAIEVTSADLFREDGVLVTRQGEARRISAVWQLVVLITPPNRPPLGHWIDQIRRGASRVNRTRWWNEMEHWEHRLNLVEQQMAVTTGSADRPTRTKRSPFDFLGAGASWLFGVATKEQLEEVAAAVRLSTLRTDALVHNAEHLLTIMNTTRRVQIATARRLHQTGVFALKALRGIEKLQLQTEDLERVVQISTAVEEVADVSSAYVQARAQYHRIQTQIDEGVLTEQLLDHAQLKHVLAVARAAGRMTLNSHWYYRNALVHPVWGRGRKVAFSVALPLVATDRYIQYNIKYLPVRFGQEHLRYLTGAGLVAVSTRRGSSFLPNDCAGSQPAVCRPAVEARKVTCETALVTGGNPAACTVRIVKNTDQSATVLAPTEGSNLVTIAPHTSELMINVRCPGKESVEVRVRQPTLVTLPPTCHMEGDRWVLHSVTTKKKMVEVTTSNPLLQLPSLNVSWPDTLHPELRSSLTLLPELRVPVLDIGQLQRIPHGYVTSTALNSVWYALAGAVALGALVSATVVARRKCGRVHKYVVSEAQPVTDEQADGGVSTSDTAVPIGVAPPGWPTFE